MAPPPDPASSPGPERSGRHGAQADPDIDPDIELADQSSDEPAWPRQRSVVGAVALGGILGAEARYGLSRALPHPPDGFPWSTLVVNLTGCLLIGALMATLPRLPSPHRLARPFLGTGVLGGYTTYATFAVEVQHLLRSHRPWTASGYLVATVLGGAVAVWLASALVARAWQPARRDRGAVLEPPA